MRNAAPLGALLGAGALLCSSCLEPISELSYGEWRPEAAVPVLNTSFTLADAMKGFDFSGTLAEGDAGELRIRVQQELFSIAPGDLLVLPDLALPLLDTVTRFDINGRETVLPVTRMVMSGGTSTVRFRNDFPLDATVVVEVENFAFPGGALTHTLTVPALSEAGASLPLAGSVLRLNERGTLTIRYRAALSDGTGVRMTLGSIAFTDTDYTVAEGRLDQLALDLGSDSIQLDFLDALTAGQVALVDPSATLRVHSTAGAPFRMLARDGVATSADGEALAIRSGLDQGLDIAYQTELDDRTARITEYRIDASSSNIVEVLNTFPSQLKFGLEGMTNPASLDSTFFLHRDARLRGELALDVPLELRFDGFVLERDFALDGGPVAEAEAVTMVMHIDNGFGLAATAQIYFYGQGGELLDSLFADGQAPLLLPAEVRRDGSTLAATTNTLEIPLDAAQLAALVDTRSARVRLSLTSPGDGAGSTTLFSDNTIAVRLGARAILNPDLDAFTE